MPSAASRFRVETRRARDWRAVRTWISVPFQAAVDHMVSEWSPTYVDIVDRSTEVPVYSYFATNPEEVEEARQTFMKELEELDVETFMAQYHLR